MSYILVVCLLGIVTYSNPVLSETTDNTLPASCNSGIYCESNFLHDVQISRVYEDSKDFVDKKLKFTESQILGKYNALKDGNKGVVPSKLALQKFIDENMENGDELEKWTPPDFTNSLPITKNILDIRYKNWTSNLNEVWKTLARKVKTDVKDQPDKYSLIWVPNGFVIPGGRFRELYYWDTYWIVNGLLLCNMTNTAKGVIDNILYMVHKFGFMPNGGRVYYLNRSQPPMLIQMVLKYYQATNDFDYVKSVISDLDREFQFWENNRMINFKKNGKSYKMARFYALSRGPRPESYREDYESAEHFNTIKEKTQFYNSIKSGAETGWDFSSRWFITKNGSNHGQLSDIRADQIVPVDLNSLLHKNALTLNTWYKKIGNSAKAEWYNTFANTLLTAIQEVMWREDKGIWFDWDLLNMKHREYFYVSNVVPLWTESYSMPKKAVARAVLNYLKDQKVIENDYSVNYKGTPTSTYPSSQQWDFPNAWPPLQAFIIQGLDNTQETQAQQVAGKLAEVWLRSNYKGFAEKSMMFEKYNVSAAGETGNGGEYTPQTGFGWTNGVVFELLNRWGNSTTYK